MLILADHLSERTPEDGDPPPTEAFEIACSGRRVDLLLHPVTPGVGPPDVDAIVAALRHSPLRSVDRDLIARALDAQASGPSEACIAMGEVLAVAEDGAPCVVVAAIDGLAAYVVPADPPPAAPAEPVAEPPSTDADTPTDATDPTEPADPAAAAEPAVSAEPTAELLDIDAGVPVGAAEFAEPAEAAPLPAPPPLVTAEGLRAILASAGIVGGLLDDVIDGFGAGERLADIRCVARGQLPVAGANASVEYHFDSEGRGAPVSIAHGAVDFRAVSVQRFVTAGAPLLTRHALVAGIPGYDVFGAVSQPPPVKDIDLARLAGNNVAVEGDVIVASIVGRPVISSRGVIEVLPVFEIAGNVDYAVGNINFPGDVIVRGDVRSGFSIVAGGSVVVRGFVEGASITAARDLSVMGVVGEHGTVFEVGGDLSAHYLHTTEARVAGTVNVLGEIINCDIAAERVHTGVQGRIVGGLTVAHADVDVGTLGSREGTLTEVRVTSTDGESVIRARRVVQPGVVVQIGDARRAIEDQIDGASFWNVDDAVLALKSTAGMSEAEAARATLPAALPAA